MIILGVKPRYEFVIQKRPNGTCVSARRKRRSNVTESCRVDSDGRRRTRYDDRDRSRALRSNNSP